MGKVIRVDFRQKQPLNPGDFYRTNTGSSGEYILFGPKHVVRRFLVSWVLLGTFLAVSALLWVYLILALREVDTQTSTALRIHFTIIAILAPLVAWFNSYNISSDVEFIVMKRVNNDPKGAA